VAISETGGLLVRFDNGETDEIQAADVSIKVSHDEP
jgi:hypothetical protein